MKNNPQNRKRKSIITSMSNLRLKVLNWVFNRIYYIFVFCLLFLAYALFCIHYQDYTYINTPVFFIIKAALAIAFFVCVFIVLGYLSFIMQRTAIDMLFNDDNKRIDIIRKCKELGIVLIDLLKKTIDWVKTNFLTIVFAIALVFVFLFFEDKIVDGAFSFINIVKGSTFGIFLLWILWGLLFVAIICVIIKSINNNSLSDGRTVFLSIVLCSLFVYCTLMYPWGKDSPIKGYEWTFPVLIILYGFCFLILPFIQYFRVAFKKNKYIQSLEQKGAGNYLMDNPVDSIEKDKLFFGVHLQALKKRIDEIPTSGSHSIAITGGWGTGKTSFLKLLEKKLEKQNQYEIMWFNPLKSSKSGNIQNDFFDVLESSLSKYKIGFGRRIKYYKELIGAIDNKYVSFLVKLGNIQLKEEEERINDVINMIPKKIIIIIDDVDRLSGSEINQVFKLVGFNARFNNIVFLIPLDKKNVIKALGCETNYPDKFFEMEFPLPDNYRHFTSVFVKDKLRELLTGIPLDFLDESTVFDYTSYCISTMRDAKRFINNFIDRVKMINKKLDPRSYYLLSLIQYKAPDLYEKIQKKELFEIEKESDVEYYAYNNEKDSSKIEDTIRKMLEELFPPKRKSNDDEMDNLGYLYQSQYFDYYFNDASTKAISDGMMTKLLSTPSEDLEKVLRSNTNDIILKQSIIELLDRYGKEDYQELLLENEDSERLITNYYRACGIMEINNGLTYSEGLTPVKIRQGKYAYINEQGEVAFYFECERAFSFSESLARVRRVNKIGLVYYGFINKIGELVIPPKYSSASDFTDGRADVTKGMKKGWIDKNGNFKGSVELKSIMYWFIVKNN